MQKQVEALGFESGWEIIFINFVVFAALGVLPN
jgi:hypothetical protein